MSTSPKPLRRGRWPRATLKDILEAAQLGFACGARDPSGIVQLRMNNVTPDGEMRWDELVRVPPPGNMDSYLLNSGDVLFNNTNSVELVGKTALFCGYSEPVVFSNHFTRLQARRDVILPEFLAFWLRLRWNEGLFAEGCNRWVGQAAFNRNKLMSVQIPLPSLLEQRRIVAVLDEQLAEVDRARAAVEARLRAVRALPEAFLREVFDGPEAKKWPAKTLGEVSTINPRRPKIGCSQDDPTSFVPMELVSPDGGGIIQMQVRPYEEVCKGYTYFEDGDVLFAKITPCMQNGKHAVARNLLGGFGFGTTEFHVIRANDEVLPEWIHRFLIRSSLLQQATYFFTGSVGQQRIPKEYLAELMIPLPPLDKQRRIILDLEEKFSEVSRILAALEAQLNELNLLPVGLLEAAFSGQI